MKVFILILVVLSIWILSFRTVLDPLPLPINELKTGDLLLFSSDTNPLPWSHTGLVYIDPKTSQKLVFESIKVGDYAPEPHIDGVVLTPLYERLHYYVGPIIVRQLHPHRRTQKFLRKFDDIVKTNLGRPFNNSTIPQLIRRWVSGPQKLHCTICSEITADVLIETGIISEMNGRLKYPWFMSTNGPFYELPFGPEKYVQRDFY
jgi:hypothetical protein